MACVKRRAMNEALFPEPERERPIKKAAGPQADACRIWHSAWQQHRGCRYAWTDKDAALIAKALKLAEGSLELLRARIERLLSESDDVWLARNAGPGVLVSHWNQLSYTPPPKPVLGPQRTYVKHPGPVIPPPPNLMDMYRKAKEAALRATSAKQLGAPKAPSG